MIDAVDQVEVDEVGGEPLQLRIEEPESVLFFLDQPDGEFVRDQGLLTVAILQCLADDGFAFFIVIGVGGIDIVYPAVDCMPDESDGLRLIYIAGRRQRKAHGSKEDRSIRPVRYYPYTRSHGPSSTLTSTAEDLLKWADVHMAGFASAAGQGEARRPEAILSPGTYRQICREYAEVPNNREKMGLGWFMRRQEGCLLYGHEGTDDGFRASLWMCPERQTAIAVLSNLSGAPVKKISKKLFKLLADQRP